MPAIGAFVLAAAAVAGALLPAAANAQAYPSRPITLIVPFPPGGPTDASARIVAKGLGMRLNEQIVVDNRAGAGGTVAPATVARAAPDGYTLLWAGTSSLAMGPALYGKLGYDPIKSFTPISLVVRSPHLLVGRADLPARDIKELVALAKSEPGKLTFGSAGAGSSTHLTGELFKSTFGVNLLHVGYKGGAPAVTDLLGKQIDMLFDAVPPLAPHVKAGALKAYAVTGTKRSPLLPDVPTVTEMLGKDFDAYSWFGLVAPAGTPPEVVGKLTVELRAALADKSVREQLEVVGFEVLGTSPEVYAKTIASELGRWTRVVKTAGITAE
jgi:tripartite-type tricarboxylate transporter receptor subunit TctC